MIGRIDTLQFGMDGAAVLSIRIPNKESAINAFNELHDKDVEVNLKKKSQKRSLDANGYCWALIGKIMEKTGVPREEVYRKAVREVGVSTIVGVLDEAVERFCLSWAENGKGWQTDVLPGRAKGVKNVIAYYGSSTYTTAEMARLIDYIVDEAKGLGIETMTPAELAGLKERWV